MQALGFPLYTEVGVNGGYRVLPNRILPPLQLTQQEALGLFMMLEYLQQVPDFPYGSMREHLAEQYFSTLPEDVQDLIMRMREHITFVQHPGGHSEPLTTEILGAAVEREKSNLCIMPAVVVKKSRSFPMASTMSRDIGTCQPEEGPRIIVSGGSHAAIDGYGISG